VTDDPYTDPATGVLRNRLGITDPARLRQAEAGLSYAALAELAIRGLPGGYDLDHLRGFHREIFGDLYPGAGEIRTLSIARTDLFCLPQHIESYAHEIFTSLAVEQHLRGLDRETFVDRLTHYLAEVNALHPFREGNGRTQRAFFRQLSRQAGWRLDWSTLDRRINDRASAASLHGDSQPLRDLLSDVVGHKPS
jgi:cell filamentation protein